ncbi:MAG TPA: SH3 domain-containing protein [Steroidobacteraceae bacterium]|nr:SH3 domain-containing protein [Steroidobacteraceae bacterium]
MSALAVVTLLAGVGAPAVPVGAQEPGAPAPAQTGAQEPRPPEPRPPGPRAAPPSAPQPLSQPVYVIEQLAVGLYSTPDVTGERVTTVKSGDRLEVLERAGEQVRVRTAGGREGWIRVSYLQSAEPLRPQLAERTAEVARLKEDVSRLEKDLQAAHASASIAPKPPARSSAVPLPGAPPEPVVREPRRGLFEDAPDEGGRRVWPWALAAGLAALCVGFALGLFTLDRHIRRKYGGLRIY